MNQDVFEDERVPLKDRSKQASDQFTDDHLEIIARKRGQLDKRIQHTYDDDDARIQQQTIPSFEARHRF